MSLVVVGTTFLDVKAFPQNPLDPPGRNLGQTRFFHGGVGRNVAEAAALVGAQVTFVSSVDGSGIGPAVLQRLQAAGVDSRGVAVGGPESMGVWTAILQNDGGLFCSVSQPPDFTAMSALVERDGDALFAGARACVIEIDLTGELTTSCLALAKRHGVPVVGLPGNMDVVRHYPQLLGELDTLIVNDHEAGQLVGFDVTVTDRPGRLLMQTGARRVIVTLGAQGALVLDGADAEVVHIPAHAVEMVDSSGAGDSFVAGTAAGLWAGLPLAEAARLGARTGAFTVASPETVPPELAAWAASDPIYAPLRRAK